MKKYAYLTEALPDTLTYYVWGSEAYIRRQM